MLRLIDLGERRILSELIPNFAQGVGNDCAEAAMAAGSLVITTDPVPVPAAFAIAKDPNPYWAGWLLVTINASDVAAAGGRPRGFLASLDMPRDWPVDNLTALLQGIKDCTARSGLQYMGGNIREAAAFSATGVAFGDCVGYSSLTRSDARIGDAIYCFGQGGQFWCDAMAVRGGLAVDKSASPMFSPVSQIATMWQFARAGLLSAAMDTSDGFLPTLEELAAKSKVRFTVELGALTGHEDHGGHFRNNPRCWFGWGDWTVLATAPRENARKIFDLASSLGVTVRRIGTVDAGAPGAWLRGATQDLKAPSLNSERFSTDSWFSAGIERYIQLLNDVPLPEI